MTAGPSHPVFRYRAYGLAVHSEIELPELAEEESETPDLEIRRRPIDRPEPEPPAFTHFDFAGGDHYLVWRSVARYLIRDRYAIDVDPSSRAPAPLVRLPLLGAVMALALHLRGALVLHASAVAIGDRSAMFLGNKQAGKSTIAAALVAAGHRLLTDDILALDFSDHGRPRILPGYPQIKLSLPSAEAISDEGRRAQAPAQPGFEKRQHRFVDRFGHQGVTPTCFFVLERGAGLDYRRLAPVDALTALIRFSYVSRFGEKALGGSAGRHLTQISALAGTHEVGRLSIPDDLGRIEEAVRFVERCVSHRDTHRAEPERVSVRA